MTFSPQLLTKLTVVVNLAVEGDDVTAVMGEHRLMTGAAGIYDRQTPVAKGYLSPLRVYDFGSPDTLVVPTAMLDALKHRGRIFSCLRTNYASDATHNKSSTNSE